MKELIMFEYINELLKNQATANTPYLQDVFSKSEYEKLLRPVLTTISQNPTASLTTIRFLLFQRSGLKEIINDFIKESQITPGVILDFGTTLTRDTVICGNSQEYTIENGKLISCPKPMEQNTIFDLASTSKLFTAISILKLEELGLLDIYEPIKNIVPDFIYLDNVSSFDLLKFRIKISTSTRVDRAKNPEEAQNILFTVHPTNDENDLDAYTDMGAMVLRFVVEKVSKMSFNDFVEEMIFKPANMVDTHLIVPIEKRNRVANENYSITIDSHKNAFIRRDNYPGTQHDPKALALGAKFGVAPGHAGYFSTKDDMIKLGQALINETILNKESVLSMSDNVIGAFDGINYSRCYGSLVYLKQPDPHYLSVYPPLSGKAFISPGYAGTTLCVDPLNNITLFIGANRLHNRIHSIHPNVRKYIKVDPYTHKQTFTLPNNEEKIVCMSFTKDKEKLVRLALDLSLQYQLLERLIPKNSPMHLVRELN